MRKDSGTSRRALLRGLAIAPLVQFSTEAKTENDTELVILGRKFDLLAAEIDHSIEQGPDIDVNVLEQFNCVLAKILTIQATTIGGLSVKARAVCWGLLGDLDHADDMTLNHSMALSIIRDLIRLHNPHLEHPGALRKLVDECTNCVTKFDVHEAACDEVVEQ